jgi:hypothetical protein
MSDETTDTRPKVHRLDLLSNATDSLNEGLAKYVIADGNEKALKFCILHLVHFVELYFKYCVAQRHWLLVFKKPSGSMKDALTIDVYEALQILKNDGVKIDPALEQDIQWLKRLRNKIEHYEFDMNLEEVDNCIGRLMYAIHAFDEEIGGVDIRASIEQKLTSVYDQFAENYFIRMKAAREKIKQAEEEAYRGYRPKEFGLVRWNVTTCPNCSNETMIPDDESSTGYRCAFCDETEPDEYEVESDCEGCGSPWPRYQLHRVEIGEDEDTELRCPVCRRDPEYVRDD